VHHCVDDKGIHVAIESPIGSALKAEEGHCSSGEDQENHGNDEKRVGLASALVVALRDRIGKWAPQRLQETAVASSAISNEEARMRLLKGDIFELCHQSTAVA